MKDVSPGQSDGVQFMAKATLFNLIFNLATMLLNIL